MYNPSNFISAEYADNITARYPNFTCCLHPSSYWNGCYQESSPGEPMKCGCGMFIHFENKSNKLESNLECIFAI